MNIFLLSTNPTTCAQMHCDKHVVKMVLETAQILSTVHHQQHPTSDVKRYKPTHANHPCTRWAASSPQSLWWLGELGVSLCAEYRHRFKKIHACEPIILGLHGSVLADGEEPNWLTAAQAMPDKYQVPSDPVAAYRAYYVGEKARMFKYTKREVPAFIKELTEDGPT